MTLFIIDVDGTITNASERLKRAGKEPSKYNIDEYKAWLSAVQNRTTLLGDSPVPGMADLVWGLSTIGQIAYVTAREEKWRGVTEEWMERNDFPMAILEMRPDDTYEETVQYKEDAILNLLEHYSADSVVVIDDDPEGTLAPMYEDNGWTFLKASAGY